MGEHARRLLRNLPSSTHSTTPHYRLFFIGCRPVADRPVPGPLLPTAGMETARWTALFSAYRNSGRSAVTNELIACTQETRKYTHFCSQNTLQTQPRMKLSWESKLGTSCDRDSKIHLKGTPRKTLTPRTRMLFCVSCCRSQAPTFSLIPNLFYPFSAPLHFFDRRLPAIGPTLLSHCAK